jgi:hypothetical protein
MQAGVVRSQVSSFGLLVVSPSLPSITKSGCFVRRLQRSPVRRRARPCTQANLQTNLVAEMVALSFTPVESLLGGVAVGIAAGATVLLNGRIMGLSGIARYV